MMKNQKYFRKNNKQLRYHLLLDETMETYQLAIDTFLIGSIKIVVLFELILRHCS